MIGVLVLAAFVLGALAEHADRHANDRLDQGDPMLDADDTTGQVICDHHACTGTEPAMWRASDRNAVLLGEWCTEHVGDGLDGFDGDVTLVAVNRGW